MLTALLLLWLTLIVDVPSMLTETLAGSVVIVQGSGVGVGLGVGVGVGVGVAVALGVAVGDACGGGEGVA